MKKKAQASPPPYWNQVLPLLKADPRFSQEAKDRFLNRVDGIVWELTPPPGASPNAVGYVTSEDDDGNGKIDKIHLILSNLPPNVPGTMSEFADQMLSSLEEDIGGIIAHEYGHIKDYKPRDESQEASYAPNLFPGGEAIAEQAEAQFHQQKAASIIVFLETNGFIKEAKYIKKIMAK